MKGDLSRSSFDRKKHYRSVLMQQGRVQMDADWNEQLGIDQHVEHTTVKDIIGPDGVPVNGGGFRIDAKADGSELLISAGRIYVDGILCENEALIAYSDQFSADYPDNSTVANVLKGGSATVGIVYLDVWERHITSLEDPDIREVALGGPDSATRAKVVWQVKVLPVAGAAITTTPTLTDLLNKRAAAGASLEAAEKGGDLGGIVKASRAVAAINGNIANLIAPSGVHCLMSAAPWTTLVSPSSGQITARVHPGQASVNPCELLPLGGYQRLENQLYRVEIHDPGPMGTATFKWSRENGSVVTSWLGQDNLNLKVASTGRDAPLGFASGQWVELVNDTRDLLGKPGMMVQIDRVEGDILTMKAPVSGTIKYTDYPRNPKIRRWDQPDTTEKVQVPAANGGYIALEGGVEILFSGTQFKTGDYWLIPARTAIADTEVGGIEWPQDAAGNGLAQSPAGIKHHYCRLGLVLLDAASKLGVLSDCRDLFPAATELRELFFLGGDGQEAQPGAVLAQPLRAGVSIGKFPVPGVTVRFRVVTGTGLLNGVATQTDILTDTSGVASCLWTLDATTLTQVVEADLLGVDGSQQHLPIRYTATLQSLKPVLSINDLVMADNFSLRNGSQIVADEMIRGIRIVCNAPVMNASLSRSMSCFVTLYLPYPLGGNNFFDVTTGSLGYDPVIVKAQVAVDPADPRAIIWKPQAEAAKWLSVFFSRLANFNIPAVPALLTVKGSFILPANAPFIPLDADGFIDSNSGLLALPTGDGRPGGDLELYFWFVNQRVVYYYPGNPIPFTHLNFVGIGSDLI